MKENKLIIDVLITTGLMLILLIVVLVIVTFIANKELFEMPYGFGYYLYITLGNIKILLSQIMLGFGIIGGAQIIFLLIKKTNIN